MLKKTIKEELIYDVMHYHYHYYMRIFDSNSGNKSKNRTVNIITYVNTYKLQTSVSDSTIQLMYIILLRN